MVSLPPPGCEVTMMRMGRSGHAALTLTAPTQNANAAQARALMDNETFTILSSGFL